MSTGGDVPDSTVSIPKQPSMDSLQELTKTKQKVKSPASSVKISTSAAEVSSGDREETIEVSRGGVEVVRRKGGIRSQHYLAERKTGCSGKDAAIAQLQAVEDLDFRYEPTESDSVIQESDSVIQERTAEYVRNQESIVQPQEDLRWNRHLKTESAVNV